MSEREARVVTTSGGLDALRPGSVIVAANGEAFISATHERQYGPRTLWSHGGTAAFASDWFEKPIIGAGLPAKVLYEPRMRL
jgi:hypothetical protein